MADGAQGRAAGEGDANLIGAVNRLAFVGRLPYRLAFDMRVTRREPPTALSGSATGELEGVGEWTLRGDGESTVVRYVWSIRTTGAWMNAFAPLPFVKEIFALNHHAVMRNGLAGIRRLLGGIEGVHAPRLMWAVGRTRPKPIRVSVR